MSEARITWKAVIVAGLLIAGLSAAPVFMIGLQTEEPEQALLPDWTNGIVTTPLFNAIAESFGVMPPPSVPYVLDLDPDSEGVEQSLWTVRLTENEAIQDVETTVTALTVGATDYVFVGFMSDMDTRPGPQEYLWRLRLALGKTDTPHTVTTMPMPPGYNHAADPILAANYASTGTRPHRVYYGGLFFTPQTSMTAIGAWYSDPPYSTWTGPVFLEESGSSQYVLDKPDIVVSDYSSTRGEVYAAYAVAVRAPGGSWSYRIRFARSTNGGVTYSAPQTVATGALLNWAQVVVNPFYGRIYLIWIDYGTDHIMMRFSDNQGSTWSAPEVAATGSFLGGPDNDRYLWDDVKAMTGVQARFNWSANRLGLVYHQWQDESRTNTDVWFVSKGAQGWSAPRRVNPVTVNDQWMAGLDFDPDGNWLVSFLDRSGDPSNRYYVERWVRLAPDGTVLEDGGPVPGAIPTDPWDNHNGMFVGDYQEIWWWDLSDQYADRFFLAFPQGNNQGDIYLSAVQ